MPDGALEVGLYDRDDLQSERALLWRVEAASVHLLCEALPQRLGEPMDGADGFLDRLAQAFPTWFKLKPWLLGGPWPVRHPVDPWP